MRVYLKDKIRKIQWQMNLICLESIRYKSTLKTIANFQCQHRNYLFFRYHTSTTFSLVANSFVFISTSNIEIIFSCVINWTLFYSMYIRKSRSMFVGLSSNLCSSNDNRNCQSNARANSSKKLSIPVFLSFMAMAIIDGWLFYSKFIHIFSTNKLNEIDWQ